MNSISEDLRAALAGTALTELALEAARNIAARNGEEVYAATAAPMPKRLFDGPKYDGKECAVCHRHFKASSEYVTCRLCGGPVCRRKGTCKGVHSGLHRVALNKAQQTKESNHG